MDRFIASDHAGLQLKEFFKCNMNLIDLGTHDEESCDYPVFAKKMAARIGTSGMGILICRTGIGMSIAANRYENVRAALCFNTEMAALARQHNNANVIVFGSDFILPKLALACAEKFFSTNFEEGRHRRRVDLINSLKN